MIMHPPNILRDNAPSKYTSGFLGGLSTLERNFPVYLQGNHIFPLLEKRSDLTPLKHKNALTLKSRRHKNPAPL
jgi:hypothetical protein